MSHPSSSERLGRREYPERRLADEPVTKPSTDNADGPDTGWPQYRTREGRVYLAWDWIAVGLHGHVLVIIDDMIYVVVSD